MHSPFPKHHPLHLLPHIFPKELKSCPDPPQKRSSTLCNTPRSPNKNQRRYQPPATESTTSASASAAATDPREVIRITLQYLQNNQSRMNYPEYRKQGLPVTTAWMESLVKEINWRTKGTEMFWNNPSGAEAILQVRAAALCDDDRLKHHLQTRPGNPFTRRPKFTKLSPEKIKS